MKRSILIAFDKMGDSLSTLNAQFAYRLMNLCVKSEPVSLLSVNAVIEGECLRIEECAQVSKDDDYTFKVFPNYEGDIPALSQAILKEHPEFKLEIKSEDIDSIDDEGNPTVEKVPYILLTMPEVDDERYDVLKDGVKVLYDEAKVRMDAAITNADAKFATLSVGESEDDAMKLKEARDKQVKTWTEQRDKLYEDKLKEIEEAHDKWLSKQSEERLKHIQEISNKH